MNRNKNTTNLHSRKRINVNEVYEMKYWSRALNITTTQLRRAIERIGPSTDELYAFLKG